MVIEELAIKLLDAAPRGKKEMNTQKKEFLRNEFLTMSILGALGRSRTYTESASQEEKNRFRDALRAKLDHISRRYESAVAEEDHLSNIINLSDELSSQFSHCLKNDRFRIGIAQKALNLNLKYLWCADLIATPPHCPFDSIVIGHLKECRDPTWTSIDSIEDYSRLVLAAKKIAADKSLAEWECDIWLDDIQSGRESKYFANNQNNKVRVIDPLEALLPTVAEGGVILITGTVSSQSKYADGKDFCELSIHREGEDALPHEPGQARPISLIIGNIYYDAVVRETGAGQVWISSVLYENTPRRKKVRLVDALEEIGLAKGHKIRIRTNNDGTFSLEPYRSV